MSRRGFPPPRRLLPRRSSLEWTIRGVLAAMAAGIGYVTAMHSFAEAIARRDPTLAHALSPGNGQIAAILADERFKAQPTADARSLPARLARRALQQDPTAIKAVTVLGFQAQLRGDLPAARRWFGYSQALSRRNFATQLWAVEDSVARGDIAATLRHYDIALRTTRAATDVMFPVLATAITDPAIRNALIETLAKKPVWTGKFVAYLASNRTDARSSAYLYTGLRRVGVLIPAEADAAVVNGLIDDDAFADAWRYYVSVRRGADPRRSRDPGFTADLTTPSPFDWIATTDPDLAASFQRGKDGGVFDFAALSGAAGLLLRQVQMLPPGDYRLEGRSIEIERPEPDRPYWVLTCRAGPELGRVVVPNSTQAGGAFSGRFRVPAGCPVQTLALMARPSENIAGVSGQLDRVRLIPAE